MHFRFVHAADLHLDTPFTGLARVDDTVAQALRDASLSAWDALVDLAIEEQAAFLLLAGDIYDGPSRGLRPQLRLLAGIRRLVEANVKVLAVFGNHDPVGGGWSAVTDWPAGVTLFPADAVTAVPIERDGRRLATVHGISFGRAEETDNLAARFRRSDEPGLHVGLLHANVGAQPDHGNYAPARREDLLAAHLDYWALGHVHRHRTVIAGDPCWAVYPGSLQGRSPAPGEQGAKGAVVVECDDQAGVLAPPRFVPLDRARFLTVDVDAGREVDAAGVTRAVSDRLALLHDQPEHAGRGLLVRVAVGHLPVAAAGLGQGVHELEQEVRDQLAGLDPFVWCESIRLSADAAVDPEVVAGRSDFAGELLARARELCADAAELAELLAGLDQELPAALRRDLPAVQGDSAQALLAAAERECLRLLLGTGTGGP